MGYAVGGAGTELISRVRMTAQGTPFAVVSTPDGFDVTADIASPQWRGMLYRQSVRQTFTHHVSLDESAKTLTVTSEMRVLEWHAGAEPGAPPIPFLGKSLSKTSGRVIHKSFVKTYGTGEDGRFGKVGEYRFSSEEGRRLILDAAAALGWTVKRGRHEKIGIIAAIAGVGIALIVVLVLVVGFVIASVAG